MNKNPSQKKTDKLINDTTKAWIKDIGEQAREVEKTFCDLLAERNLALQTCQNLHNTCLKLRRSCRSLRGVITRMKKSRP